MIRRHKEEVKRRRTGTVENVPNQFLTTTPRKIPEHIRTEENIKVASGDDPDFQTQFQNIKPRKRRRSIMASITGELNRPHLSPMKEPLKKKLKDLSDGGSSSRESSPKPTMPPGGFKMPTGQHMNRLCKLHVSVVAFI